MPAPSLTQWFKQQVAAQCPALTRNLYYLVALQSCSLVALIAAFWQFAAIMHQWVVAGELAQSRQLLWLGVWLLLHWSGRGLAAIVSLQATQSLNAHLESRMLACFLQHQHALARQYSAFYWQTLWLSHIPALSHWHYQYRAQQMVAVIMPVVVLTAIFYVNVVIGLSLLITLPVVPLFMIIVGKGAAHLHRQHFVALERLGGLFTDRLAALPMLASFRAHAHQQSLLQNASDQLNTRTMKVVGVAFLSASVLDFFSTLAVALIAVFIGFSLLGEISLGPTVTFAEGLWVLLTVPLLLSEMKRLGTFYHQKADAEAARAELEPLFTPVTDATTHVLPLHQSSFSGADFETFSLVEPPLQAKRLRLEAGQHIRLTGHSGAGKTVLLEALAGQRHASHWLNGDIVWLSQQPVLLPASVRDNLCLGEAMSDTSLLAALDQVALSNWLKQLPQGLDTQLSAVPPLSGGEAQRFALARLLLRNADIWLLDEPTAHVSDTQHRYLADLIHRCAQDRTIIWASHKPLPESWFDGHWHIEDEQVIVR